MNKIKMNCTKCNGKGFLSHYANIANGECFDCKGIGYTLVTQKQYDYIMKENERMTKAMEEEYKEDERLKEERKREEEKDNCSKLV